MRLVAQQFLDGVAEHGLRLVKADCQARCSGKDTPTTAIDAAFEQDESDELVLSELKWSQSGAQTALDKAEADLEKLRLLLAGPKPKWLLKGGGLGRPLPLPCQLAAFGLGPTTWKCRWQGALLQGSLGTAPPRSKRRSGGETGRDPGKRAISRARVEAKRAGKRKRSQPQRVMHRPSGAPNWPKHSCAGCAYKQ